MKPYRRQSAAAHRYIEMIEHERRIKLSWAGWVLVVLSNLTFYGGVAFAAWLLINAPR